MGTKVCTRCHLEKDISEFGWERLFQKRASQCKQCRVEVRMQYYDENKEKELEYKWKRQLEKREEARIYVVNYLSNHPCVGIDPEGCPYHETDPSVLTFDHVRGIKKMAISQMVNQGYSIKALQEEIDKCEVRCHNCHHRIEKQRRGTKYPGL